MAKRFIGLDLDKKTLLLCALDRRGKVLTPRAQEAATATRRAKTAPAGFQSPRSRPNPGGRPPDGGR